jgi:nicotinamidase-related amidase
MAQTTASSSALVVVDYQNDFCHPDGAFGRAGHDLSAVQAVAEPIRRLRQEAHRCGVPVILVRVEHSEWTDDQAWIRRFEGLPDEARPKGAVATKGSWGADFYELDADDRDLVLVKHRYSAFAYTPLELVLRARSVTQVVICGVQTDVCVLGTGARCPAGWFPAGCRQRRCGDRRPECPSGGTRRHPCSSRSVGHRQRGDRGVVQRVSQAECITSGASAPPRRRGGDRDARSGAVARRWGTRGPEHTHLDAYGGSPITDRTTSWSCASA